MSEKDIKFQDDYKYGFKDEDVSTFKTAKGLNEDVVRMIEKIVNDMYSLENMLYFLCTIL